MSWSTGPGEPAGDGSALPGAIADRVPGVVRSRAPYRLVLTELVDRGGSCPLSALTRRLVESAVGPAGSESASDRYRLAHLSLVREYVPVLEEFGAVTYDEETGEVSLAVDTGPGANGH